MKGCLVLFLLTALLMLLLPLPSLGSASPDPGGPDAAPSADPVPTDPLPPREEDVFRVLDAASGAVVEMGEREFLIGTLAAEMYPSYHIEALKAQAVAAYTYYGYRRAAARAEGAEADFSDVPSTFPDLYAPEGMRAKWGDKFPAYYEKICQAADAVLGQRILYGGEPIMAVYHALSPEQTESAAVIWGGEIPYLQPVPNAGDTLAPAWESVVTVPVTDFAAGVKSLGVQLSGEPDKWINFTTMACSPSGTVTSLQVGDKVLNGRQIRALFDLRSAVFTVVYRTDSGFTFTVHGYGHGVGMSQYGANCLAAQGKTYIEILQYYYKGVTVE